MRHEVLLIRLKFYVHNQILSDFNNQDYSPENRM